MKDKDGKGSVVKKGAAALREAATAKETPIEEADTRDDPVIEETVVSASEIMDAPAMPEASEKDSSPQEPPEEDTNEGSDETKIVFGLDIGTRNVVGTVGYRDELDIFHVVDQYSQAHTSRAMLDGQIHDITAVGKTLSQVRKVLTERTGYDLDEACIAAAGRVLKTVTTRVTMKFDEETVVTEEHVQNLDLLGVDEAQSILGQNNDTKFKFYSVGYSTVRYYANDDPMINLVGHKAYSISEDIIVTFLPEDVVDGLYMAVGLAGMTVENMTLEPIAAINIAIPKSFRMLNIALVDVGAGTSDISITRDGTIIAYGMIPKAGDELTDRLVQTYLIDFDTAEKLKMEASLKDEIEYEDIMRLPHKVSSREVVQVLRPVVSEMTRDIANLIKELNGGSSVMAVFVVGGGGKFKGFTAALAEELDIPPERVALRGEEVLGDIIYDKEGIDKDALVVTPVGICLSAYEQKNNFIFVHFNGERMKLYDNSHLTVVDAVVQAGFPNENLFPKSGPSLEYTLNGKQKMVRGKSGEPAEITINDEPASLSDPLELNCHIRIVSSTEGEAASQMISEIEGYDKDNLCFLVNGATIFCPRIATVNGETVSQYYEIKSGDDIVLKDFYTVKELMEFLDVEVDVDKELLVNNKDAYFDTEIYDNFTVQWIVMDYAGGGGSGDANMSKLEKIFGDDEDDELKAIRPGKPRDPEEDELTFGFAGTGETVPKSTSTEAQMITVNCNGRSVLMTGKADYIFVDIFDAIGFDTSEGHGRTIITTLNGHNAHYTEMLQEGDVIEIKWSEE